jgi:hypothetical protein
MAQCTHVWLGWKWSISGKFRVENRCQHCAVRMVSNSDVCNLLGRHDSWVTEDTIEKRCVDCGLVAPNDSVPLATVWVPVTTTTRSIVEVVQYIPTP